MAMVGVDSCSLYRRTHSLSCLAWSWVGGRLVPFYIGLDQRSCAMSDPVSTRMGDHLWTGKPSRYVTEDRYFSPYTLHLFPPFLTHTKSLSSSTRTTRNSMLLFCQPITAKTFLHLSRVWTLFAYGFVKMAWPSTQQISRHSVWHTQKAQTFFRSEIL